MRSAGDSAEVRDVRIRDVAAWLDELAPPHLAEDYDNVGLLVGEPDESVRGIVIALDITPAVLAEARERGANLVISHHPIWFRSRKHLRGDDFVSRQILYAIRHGIALYACHTNLDSVARGVNHAICERLGLRNAEFLLERPGGPEAHESQICQAGHGMIGVLPAALEVADFLELVRTAFGCACIRYAPGRGTPIERVAVCGGAGSFLLDAARARGADAFVTADVTYHKFFDSMGEILFLDIGHFESEQFTSEILSAAIRERAGHLPLSIAGESTNPVRYFTGPARP